MSTDIIKLSVNMCSHTQPENRAFHVFTTLEHKNEKYFLFTENFCNFIQFSIVRMWLSNGKQQLLHGHFKLVLKYLPKHLVFSPLLQS